MISSSRCRSDFPKNQIPNGASLLGVVLSSDKTNISVMSGNRMAHPLLLSLANIDADVRSKGSLHAHILLALLPVASFIHKTTRVCSLLSDRLVHESLDFVLKPLKVAAAVGIMMSDPIGNLRYCFTPLVAYTADTPEQCLLAGVSPKASPVSTATYKEFGDVDSHPPRTATKTLDEIERACAEANPSNFEEFLKVCRRLFLNGVHMPFWRNWALCDPSIFFPPEVLHMFHRLFWDHDLQWCIFVVGPEELDYRFSLIQTPVGYRSFAEGISKLKQVTGRDHRAVQRYIIGAIAGAVPAKFLAAVVALLDFRYLAQMPRFDDNTLRRVEAALRAFHTNKAAIITAGGRQGSRGPLDHWEVPKLELLQHVVRSIRASGAIMQWTADVTEHAHVTEIKHPTRSGNNQDYYAQIARHLDRSDRCFQFDIATRLASVEQGGSGEEDEDPEDEHEPDSEVLRVLHYYSPTATVINYFEIAKEVASGIIPNTLLPHRIFASPTTAFRLANKPSLWTTIDEASEAYGLANLRLAVTDYFRRVNQTMQATLATEGMQIWFKVRVQHPSYHNRQSLEPPQSLLASPPSPRLPNGQYDFAIISQTDQSDWPSNGLTGMFGCVNFLMYVYHLTGHNVVQVRLIFRLLRSDIFLAYVQRFNATIDNAAGMHVLKRAIQNNGTRVGEVPLRYIHSPAHVIPRFGKEANPRLTLHTAYELSNEFWLNKYWNKEFFYALSLST